MISCLLTCPNFTRNVSRKTSNNVIAYVADNSEQWKDSKKLLRNDPVLGHVDVQHHKHTITEHTQPGTHY